MRGSGRRVPRPTESKVHALSKPAASMPRAASARLEAPNGAPPVLPVGSEIPNLAISSGRHHSTAIGLSAAACPVVKSAGDHEYRRPASPPRAVSSGSPRGGLRRPSPDVPPVQRPGEPPRPCPARGRAREGRQGRHRPAELSRAARGLLGGREDGARGRAHEPAPPGVGARLPARQLGLDTGDLDGRARARARPGAGPAPGNWRGALDTDRRRPRGVPRLSRPRGESESEPPEAELVARDPYNIIYSSGT